MSFSCSTFASKCFLADCLHVIQFGRGCCSWSGYAMMLFLAMYRLLCHVFLMDVCLVYHEMLCSECIELTNMPTCYLFLPCPVFLLSLRSVMKLAMFTWVPSFLMVLFGLW